MKKTNYYKKIKYNIGETVYYYDHDKKQIRSLPIHEIIIEHKYCGDDDIIYVDSHDLKYATRKSQCWVRPTPEKVVKEVMGMNYAISELVEKLMEEKK